MAGRRRWKRLGGDCGAGAVMRAEVASCGLRGCGGRVGIGLEDDGGLAQGCVLGLIGGREFGVLGFGEEFAAVVVDGVVRSP